MSRRIEIDALRTLACLIIILVHIAQEFVKLPGASNDTLLIHQFFRNIDIGRGAVTLFFAISGYVIIGSLKGPVVSGSIHFWGRRVCRLYPAFWVSIPIGLWVIFMDKQQIPSFERILANVTMLPKWFGEKNIIGVYWTLETELIFYGLCWLLFTGRLHTNPLALSVIITGLVSLTYFLFLHRELAPDYHYWLAMPYHLSLMFWAALYRLYENRKTDAKPMGLVKVLLYSQTLVIALPMLFAFVLYLVNKDPQALRNATSYFLGIGLFLVLGHWLPLRSRLLASLGKYTFSIYLFHLPVILILVHVVGDHFPALAGISFVVYLLIVTVITLAVSLLCYHCIEYPCMQFAQKAFPDIKSSQPLAQSGSADRKRLPL